jgi:hypothetical protein
MITLPDEIERLTRLVAMHSGKTPEDVLRKPSKTKLAWPEFPRTGLFRVGTKSTWTAYGRSPIASR